jgi:probable F420-dependent oxidoreductase
VYFSMELPTSRVDEPGSFQTVDGLMECARAIEAAGFDACCAPDHPAPATSWLTSEKGHHALDPLVALTCAAAATMVLQLQTHAIVLPCRNPFLLAKEAASLDAVSNGRLILGVAAGYVRDEFIALGADFDSRNSVMDESIDIMTRLWTADDVRVDGGHFRSNGTTVRPRPARDPHPPIWIGGNSRAAMRRAVDRGQGWVTLPVTATAAVKIRTGVMATLDDLSSRMSELREYADEVGRASPLDIAVRPFTSGADGTFEPIAIVEELSELQRLGVSWSVFRTPPCASVEEFCAEVARFGAEIIQVLRG